MKTSIVFAFLSLLVLFSAPMMSSMTAFGLVPVSTTAVGITPSISGTKIAFYTYEGDISTDLNGDGDQFDIIIRVFDTVTSTLTNTAAVGDPPSISGTKIAFKTYEGDISTDLNGDGDQFDIIIRVFDTATSTLTNTAAVGDFPSISGTKIAFHTSESSVSTDLNGDGDQIDSVIQYLDLATSSNPSAPTQTTGQLTIQGTCGIGPLTPLNYGTLTPGQPSAEQTLTITNSGTVPGQLFVQGLDWESAPFVSQILVGNTYFGTTSTPAVGPTMAAPPSVGFESALDYAYQPITPASGFAVGPNNTFWQVVANLLNPSFTGALTQEYNFTASC